jgi:pilus assembly protein CpaB
VFVVVTSKALEFGDKITPDALKPQPWSGPVPEGAFTATRDAVGDGNRTALRNFQAGEVILAQSITGGAGRLASSTLLGPEMRAIALPVSETAAAGGFIAPGDRVDVILTRSFDEATAYAAVVVQGARVLAVGQVADPSSDQPNITKSATIEVTPAEAQKIALGQTVGTITLALRPTGDESRALLQTTSANAAFNMAPPVRNSGGGGDDGGGPPAARGPAQPAQPRGFTGPGETVRIVRGTETSLVEVPR